MEKRCVILRYGLIDNKERSLAEVAELMCMSIEGVRIHLQAAHTRGWQLLLSPRHHAHGERPVARARGPGHVAPRESLLRPILTVSLFILC